tara:strand:+ start:90 stop:1091 length:1002 start_codon:yes stop_codon:yes gene_type:complete
MKALVTGGYGFIGSHVVRKLSKEGWVIDIVDDMSNGHEDLLSDLKVTESFVDLMNHHNDANRSDKPVKFFRCDFANDNILQKVASGYYDVVFHLAAVPRVSFSVENPAETTEINLMSTVKLFDASRYGKSRVVFSSSSSVYGGADNLPTAETELKNPKSPYAWQKSACEDVAKLYCELYSDSDIVCLRYFNVFGPGQYGDSPYATAVSAWCHAIKNGTPLRSDGDGSQTRDMCYVDNVVQANFLAAIHKSTKFRGECYNVGCGGNTSNREILNYLRERYPAIEIQNAPWRPGDVMHTQADITKISEELRYEPIVKFWEGLSLTLEWWELKDNA